jgi:hypothetical protein
MSTLVTAVVILADTVRFIRRTGCTDIFISTALRQIILRMISPSLRKVNFNKVVSLHVYIFIVTKYHLNIHIFF